MGYDRNDAWMTCGERDDACAKHGIDPITLGNPVEEIARLRAVLQPVLMIYAPPPQTPAESETFERGCPLDKAQIRAMQEVMGMTYSSSNS